jgi:hypothetical protein
MGPLDRVQVHRPRLARKEQQNLLDMVGASHVIGGDWLDPCEQALGNDKVMEMESSWGVDSKKHPLIVFPLHLERLKDRLYAELAKEGSGITSVSLVLTASREKLDEVKTPEEAAQMVDKSLMEGWGDGVAVKKLTIVKQPAKVVRLSARQLVLPPVQWEEVTMDLGRILVVVTVGLSEEMEGLPELSVVGEFASLKQIQEEGRQGLVPVVVEVDLVQRPGGKDDIRNFLRRAAGELMGKVQGKQFGWVMPLPQGSRFVGNMLSGIVDLPEQWAKKLIQASGSVRGVFVRPFLGRKSSEQPSNLKVMWVKSLDRFSDVIFSTLQHHGNLYGGLVCGRTRGEVGIRVPPDAPMEQLQQSFKDMWGARCKIRTVEEQRSQLRFRGVPVLLLFELQKLVSALSMGLTVQESCVLGSGRFLACGYLGEGRVARSTGMVNNISVNITH